MFVGQAYQKKSLIFDDRHQRIATVPPPNGYIAANADGEFFDAPYSFREVVKSLL
jgi:hypothetical protein